MTFEKPNWRIALFSLCFLALFCSLAFWQLERGGEKQQLLDDADIQANLPGEFLSASLTVSNGDPIRAFGRFNPDLSFLADNRVLSGRVGYELVQVFIDNNGTTTLVNRGFVAGGLSRDQLPTLPAANKAPQAIRGHAYLTELVVPEQNIAGKQNPWVVQVVKPGALQSLVDTTLFPYIIRLEEAHPDALPRHWPVTIMSPERHFGYAFTWTIMAIAVVIAFIASIRVPNSKGSPTDQ